MAKHKLRQFAEFESFENTFTFAREMKGRWSEYFGNNHPLILELACGKGEYTTGLALLHPENNYIGIDIKGNRLWRGAKTAIDHELGNVAFLRAQIEHIDEFFDSGEIAEIWITFADPQPRKGKEHKRLTHPLFLEKYRKIGAHNLLLHLKCDSDILYDFTKEVAVNEKLDILADCNNIYNWEERPEELNIQTYYEKKWLSQGISIKYLKIKLN